MSNSHTYFSFWDRLPSLISGIRYKERQLVILGRASRSKMQYQDQHTRARGENISSVATTAPPSENITTSLDMSTGPSKGTLLSGSTLRDWN
ncbi:uncharacterized protein Bfra_001407 [Botrytis fragariae]|uniref:Uncharacterized protein n=1 Tax=Botrytis fragariae TaxID=1964551 RepID=A0A8H6B0A1_9HELO|nr:uncharacterized protein Bfra_001407 [Botrytis fragariae]KAF5877046.1 hypothetical protein Bfra_001407 [Botrytis fragariae]